jgi:hypothetical protein
MMMIITRSIISCILAKIGRKEAGDFSFNVLNAAGLPAGGCA